MLYLILGIALPILIEGYEVFSCLFDEEIDTMFTAQRKFLSKLTEIRSIIRELIMVK